MATTLKKQFLDYTGLAQFWGIIDHKFANKTDAVKVDSFNIPESERTKTSLTITYTDSNDAVNGTAGPKSYGFSLPEATENYAGLLSADHFALIDDIDNKINEAAPFHGLKIDGNETNRDGAKRANIGLEFITEGSVVDGSRRAYIELVDRNYPTTGSWSEVSAEEYNNNVSKEHYHAYTDNAVSSENFGKTTYWKWSVENVKGPLNNLGEPLKQKPVSRIDVSELVKAGLLQDADVILKNGVMYLKLIFITSGDGSETKEVLINITDLVDIYNEGEGIEITQGALSADENGVGAEGGDTGSARESIIKLRVANYDPENSKNELGGIRVGYTTNDETQAYKVQLDANGNAYVVVPWAHTTVSAVSEGQNGENANYLEVSSTPTTSIKKDANGNDIVTTNYEIKVEAGDGLKRAEGLAKTSVQDVKVGSVSETDAVVTGDLIGITKDAYLKVHTIDNGGWGRKVVTELTDSAKESLRLADVSVQNVITATIERGDNTHTPTGEDLVVTLVDASGGTYDPSKIYDATDPTKGEKTIKVTLGDKTKASLDKADTALQTVTIMGTTLNIDSPIYETGQAKQALSLGSAAYVNTVTVMPDANANVDVDSEDELAFKDEVVKPDGTKEYRYTVATTKAVKQYVDNENTKQSEELRNFTTSAINDLDAHVAVGNGTAEHADYTAAYGEGVVPHQVMIGVTQTDGKLTGTDPYILSITDIADFAPLSENDIKTICGIITE